MAWDIREASFCVCLFFQKRGRVKKQARKIADVFRKGKGKARGVVRRTHKTKLAPQCVGRQTINWEIKWLACFLLLRFWWVIVLGGVETILPLVGRERERGMCWQCCNFFIFMVETHPGHCPNIGSIEGGHFLVKDGTPSVTIKAKVKG